MDKRVSMGEIPTRADNGTLGKLLTSDGVAPSTLRPLETVFDRLLSEFGMIEGCRRVFVGLRDAQQFLTCDFCTAARIERLGK